MQILSEITPFLNGGFSAFSLAILFRVITIEKDMERERKFFIKFKNDETKNNKELDNRLRELEFQASKRWSTFRTK